MRTTGAGIAMLVTALASAGIADAAEVKGGMTVNGKKGEARS